MSKNFIKRLFYDFFAVAITIFVFSISAFAFDLSDKYSIFAKEISVRGKTFDVQSVIDDILAKYNIEEHYQTLAGYDNYDDIYKEFHIYPTRYYVGYWASENFLDELPYLNESGFSEKMFGNFERINVPVFSYVNGEERVVSSISVYYNYSNNEFGYIGHTLIEPDEELLNGEYHSSYEKLLLYIEENELDNCVLVGDNTYHAPMRILLVGTDGYYQVYDFNNILKNNDCEDLLYKLDDYASRRKEYDERMTPQYPTLMSILIVKVVIVVIAVIIVAIATIIIVRICKKKKRKES